MLLWVLLVCCCFGCVTGVTEETLLDKMYQRLRSVRNSGEIRIPGKDIDHVRRDCLPRSKFLSFPRLHSLTRPLTNVSVSGFRIFEFKLDQQSTKAIVRNGTLWFPSHILNHVIKIHVLHCEIESSDEEAPMMELREMQFRRMRRHKTSPKDGRSFDISALLNRGPKLASPNLDIDNFYTILHFSPGLQLPPRQPGSDQNSEEKGTIGTVHVSALPKPYLHVIYKESKKSIGKKSQVLKTRFCEDIENGSQEYDGPTHCCLRRLDVDFAKLGWHWIDGPKRMRIHYCDGYCPHPYGGGNTDANEDSFFTFLNGARPAAGQLCCVASEYHNRHVSVRTSQVGRIVIRSLDDIDAASCSCIA